MAQAYATAGIEPPLAELLNDPIAQLVMRRDGIAVADVWRAVEAARGRWAGGTSGAAERTRELEPPLQLPAMPGRSATRSPAG